MRRSIAKFCLVMLPAVGTSACVGSSGDNPEKARKALRAYVLDAPPKDIGNKLDINYDNKLRIIGSKIEPKGAVRPGQKVKLTLYWKCEKQIGKDGWKLFTHILDGSGERILNIDNVGPLRRIRGDTQALPPSAWKAGRAASRWA